MKGRKSVAMSSIKEDSNLRSCFRHLSSSLSFLSGFRGLRFHERKLLLGPPNLHTLANISLWDPMGLPKCFRGKANTSLGVGPAFPVLGQEGCQQVLRQNLSFVLQDSRGLCPRRLCYGRTCVCLRSAWASSPAALISQS